MQQFAQPPRPGEASRPGEAPSPSIRLVAFDLDGVVWKGDLVLPGVAEALADVLRRGLDLRYVSNNSTAHREAVSERLAGLGLPAGAERVLTSGFVTGRWLRERFPLGAPVMVIGEEGLLRELREVGLTAFHAEEVGRATNGERGAAGTRDAVVESTSVSRSVEAVGASVAAGAEGAPAAGSMSFVAAPLPSGSASVVTAAPVAVVVGMDRSFSYDTLAAAQAAVMGGALFIATNTDATFPTPSGLRPGAGSIVAAVAAATGKEPISMGKPGLALAEALAAVTGVPAAQTLLVGDRLDTDIAMGRAAGMATALVLTGVTREEDLQRVEAAKSPQYTLADLTGLAGLLGSLGA